jgi:hypothetical protein
MHQDTLVVGEHDMKPACDRGLGELRDLNRLLLRLANAWRYLWGSIICLITL